MLFRQWASTDQFWATNRPVSDRMQNHRPKQRERAPEKNRLKWMDAPNRHTRELALGLAAHRSGGETHTQRAILIAFDRSAGLAQRGHYVISSFILRTSRMRATATHFDVSACCSGSCGGTTKNRSKDPFGSALRSLSHSHVGNNSNEMECR